MSKETLNEKFRQYVKFGQFDSYESDKEIEQDIVRVLEKHGVECADWDWDWEDNEFWTEMGYEIDEEDN